MIRLAILTLLLIILNLAIVPETDEPSETPDQEPDVFTSFVTPKSDWSIYDTQGQYDLDADGKLETIYFKTSGEEYGDWKTNIFINNSKNPLKTIDDLLIKNSVQKISKEIRVLKLDMSGGGKLINTTLYQYRNRQLVEIPIITNSRLLGTWSSGGTEFKDNNNDGVTEMFVYHRHYPPEAKRTVEVYKFDGKIFQKEQEYEELMPNVYY